MNNIKIETATDLKVLTDSLELKNKELTMLAAEKAKLNNKAPDKVKFKDLKILLDEQKSVSKFINQLEVMIMLAAQQIKK